MTATRLLQLIVALALSGKALSETNNTVVVANIDDNICIRGYIMDTYCIDLGVLLDMQSISTLSAQGPPSHSLHCLLDVELCYTTPYEVLNPLEDGSFGRSWRMESNDEIITHGRAIGGCKTCAQEADTGTEGVIDEGLRLTLKAVVTDVGDSSTPPTIRLLDSGIHAYEDFETVCGENATVFVPPNGMITSGGSLVRPILIHGSLMIIAWGLLLPSGAIIAALGKHRSDAMWFKVHRVVQPIGLIVALIAWIIALRNFTALQASGGGTLHYPHAILGMITMVIGLIQPLNAIFRPHAPKKGEEKTTLRLLWEICHKGLGWVGIFLSIVTISIGTTLLADKTHRRNLQVIYGVFMGGLLLLLAIPLFLEKKRFKNRIPISREEQT